MALQLADNRTQRSEVRGRKSAKDIRGATMRAIHVTWKKVAPRDCDDADSLKSARLQFAERVLGLRRTLKSCRSLSGAQLGRVLDEMRRLEKSPTLPAVSGFGFQVSSSPDPQHPTPNPGEAEIHHLATVAQVEAIDKLFAFLAWTTDGVTGFMQRNFKRSSHRMLSPKEANSCTYILLRIGAARSIKESRHVDRVSNLMIREEIPKLKARLGIDQKSSTDFTDYTDGDSQWLNIERVGGDECKVI